jgi:hypothetical protein
MGFLHRDDKSHALSRADIASTARSTDDPTGSGIDQPVAEDASEWPANTGIPATSESLPAGGWPSARPIVIGNPTPDFEPVGVSDSYRTTPYRPDTTIDGWSSGSFTIRAASLRGHLHRYNGAPRQDDFAVAIQTDRDRLLVAVADGVGAVPHAHIGASTAVRYATQWLAEMAPQDIAEIDWRTLIQSAAWTLVEQAGALLGSAEVDAEQAEAALATTLTCAVCEPAAEGAMSVRLVCVGDSGAWVLGRGQFTRLVGGKTASESGLTSSAVSGLPRVPKVVQPVEAIVQSNEVLLIGTDGFGDPLGSGTADVGALFKTVLGERVPSLIEFAHALDFSRETFDDDRTLVAVWPRQARGGSTRASAQAHGAVPPNRSNPRETGARAKRGR